MKVLRSVLASAALMLAFASGAEASCYRWSKVANTNTSADPTINWAVGMSPSSVSPSARAMMAAEAKCRDDWSGTLLTTGTSTAYVLATNQVFSTLALMDGAGLCFRPNVANGATVTINVDGLGAKPLRSAPSVELSSGIMALGAPYCATYVNSTSEWLLKDFYSSASGATVLAANGTVSAPGFAFSSQTNTGIYRIGTSNLGIAINGVKTVDLAAGGTAFTGTGSFSGALTMSAGGSMSGTFTGSHTLSGAVTLSGGGTLTGTFTGNPTFSGNPVFSGTPSFSGASGITAKNTAKAMVYFTVSGTTPTVQKSFNVTGVVRNSQGNYTVTITTALADALFYFSGNGGNAGTGCQIDNDSRSTTTAVIRSFSANGSAVDCDSYSVVIFGD